jgi:DNA polymerase III epsilon subunit-like protein
MKEECIVFDSETTGNKENEPIEISGVYVRENNGVFGFFRIFSCPCEKVLPRAIVIHGVTDAVARTYEDPKIAAQNFLDVFEANKHLYWIGFNVQFDCDVATNFVKKHLGIDIVFKKTICLMRAGRKLYREDEMGGYNLDAVYYKALGETDEALSKIFSERSTHGALVDSTMTAELLEAIRAKLPELGTLDQFAEWVAAPMELELWPMGKYCDKKTKIVDSIRSDWRYCSWVINEQGIQKKFPDLVWTIKKHKEVLDKALAKKFDDGAFRIEQQHFM